MADLGVMEMCWGLGSLSPLRDRLMAFSPAGRSASDSRDKTRRGGGGGRGEEKKNNQPGGAFTHGCAAAAPACDDKGGP